MVDELAHCPLPPERTDTLFCIYTVYYCSILTVFHFDNFRRGCCESHFNYSQKQTASVWQLGWIIATGLWYSFLLWRSTYYWLGQLSLAELWWSWNCKCTPPAIALSGLFVTSTEHSGISGEYHKISNNCTLIFIMTRTSFLAFILQLLCPKHLLVFCKIYI